MRDQAPRVDPASVRRGHEQTDLSVRTLFVGLAVLLAFTAGSAWAMRVGYSVLQARQAERLRPTSPLVETDVEPPAPRLETAPGQIRQRSAALQRVQMETYTWIDRDAGIARIPVSRAMEILAERGLPHRDGGEEQP